MTAASPDIAIRFYGRLRERFGAEAHRPAPSEATDYQRLAEWLCAIWPELEAELTSGGARLAADGMMVAAGESFAAPREGISIMPPFSGG